MSDFNNSGYCVIETNHLSAVRTGEIKAQYPCVGMDYIENGMLLYVDEDQESVRPVHDSKEFCYLHASEERVYDTGKGRNDWRLDCSSQIPRMFKLEEGDIFETDAVKFTNFADEDEARDDAVYGIPNSSGYIELISAAQAAALDVETDFSTVLEIVDWVTLPNGDDGIKFSVYISRGLVFLKSGNVINTFIFEADNNGALSEDVEGDITGDTISLTIPYDTDPSALVATFTTSSGVTVEVGDTEQVSGTTANDFSTPVTYVVTAENGDEKEYTVTVIIAANDANDILTFELAEQTGPATINDTTHTVDIEVANGTSLAALTPTITVSPEATIVPESGTEQDFTSPVIYIVTAENGEEQEWTVTVSEAA